MEFTAELALRDIKMFSQTTVEDCEKIAKEVAQKIMRPDVREGTPIGPGRDGKHLKDGWVYGTIKGKNTSTSAILNKVDKQYYGVRNRLKPTIVHLVNFPHRIVIRGVDTGKKTKGDPFVDRTSEKGFIELEHRLDKYFNG